MSDITIILLCKKSEVYPFGFEVNNESGNEKNLKNPRTTWDLRGFMNIFVNSYQISGL